MKFLNLLLILSMLFAGVSCSSGQVDDEETQESSASSEDELDEDDADFVVDDDDEESLEDGEDALDEDVEEIAQTDEEVPEVVEEEVMESSQEVVASSAKGSSQEYVVQKGDTLMYIAFKLFGDYKKWRVLRDQNAAVVSQGIPAGTVLNYISEGFSWQHQGLPYLIRRGDTLGTISSDKYGTSKKWKSIWHNNREMIQDPNLIFAGFTLYYIAQRDLASEN